MPTGIERKELRNAVDLLAHRPLNETIEGETVKFYAEAEEILSHLRQGEKVVGLCPLHANMFLVQRAKETMERDILVLPCETSFDALLSQPDNEGRMRHIVVAEDGRIVGVLRVNTALRQASAGAGSPIALRDIASRDFTIAREDDIVFDVIQRIWRRKAVMALVVRGRSVPRPADVVGVITKEHVADSVANSVKIYPG